MFKGLEGALQYVVGCRVAETHANAGLTRACSVAARGAIVHQWVAAHTCRKVAHIVGAWIVVGAIEAVAVTEVVARTRCGVAQIAGALVAVVALGIALAPPRRVVTTPDQGHQPQRADA